MAKIYSYPIVTDAFTAYRVREPHYSAGAARVTELCTIDSVAYISVPAGVTLPEQPPQVVLTDVTLTTGLADAIKAASPHVRLINERIRQKIRDKYDAENEMYFARISIGVVMGAYTFLPGEQDAVLAYGAYVEEVRQWGRDQRAALGL